MLHNQRAIVLVQVATTAYFRGSSKTIPHVMLLHVSYMNDSDVQHFVQYDVKIEQCQPVA